MKKDHRLDADFQGFPHLSLAHPLRLAQIGQLLLLLSDHLFEVVCVIEQIVALDHIVFNALDDGDPEVVVEADDLQQLAEAVGRYVGQGDD